MGCTCVGGQLVGRRGDQGTRLLQRLQNTLDIVLLAQRRRHVPQLQRSAGVLDVCTQKFKTC